MSCVALTLSGRYCHYDLNLFSLTFIWHRIILRNQFKDKRKEFLNKSITVAFSLAGLSLLGISLLLLAWAVLQCIKISFQIGSADTVQDLLQAISAIIISIAVIDVARYLIEEEVFRDKELRSPGEARKTLTKVFVIIAIAVSLEGLVFIFKAGMDDIRLLAYPSVLLLCGTASMVGLGLYQRLSVSVEEDIGESNVIPNEDVES